MLFKLGSVKIKVKFNSTVLNPPSFLKSAFEISILSLNIDCIYAM